MSTENVIQLAANGEFDPKTLLLDALATADELEHVCLVACTKDGTKIVLSSSQNPWFVAGAAHMLDRFADSILEDEEDDGR